MHTLILAVRLNQVLDLVQQLVEVDYLVKIHKLLDLVDLMQQLAEADLVPQLVVDLVQQLAVDLVRQLAEVDLVGQQVVDLVQ